MVLDFHANRRWWRCWNDVHLDGHIGMNKMMDVSDSDENTELGRKDAHPRDIIHPEVIGEGDVISVILPDGGMHFYFIPSSRHYDNAIPTPNTYWNNPAGAFYIKSVSNPISAASFNQQYNKLYGTLFSRPCLYSDCNVNPPPAFQLKFHNDSWTSTTDLRYFYPRCRKYEWHPISSPMECTAVQTDTAVEAPNVYQVSCAKPCLCSNVNKETIDKCSCVKVHNSRSRTSMSSGRETSKTKITSKKSRLTLRKHKPKRFLKKHSNVDCKCRVSRKTDKSVTTYADQASSCTAAERDTQTSIDCAMSFIEDTKQSQTGDTNELWLPNPSTSKPVAKHSSEKIVGMFETDGSSASCCCSATDTEGRTTGTDIN